MLLRQLNNGFLLGSWVSMNGDAGSTGTGSNTSAQRGDCNPVMSHAMLSGSERHGSHVHFMLSQRLEESARGVCQGAFGFVTVVCVCVCVCVCVRVWVLCARRFLHFSYCVAPGSGLRFCLHKAL